MLLQLYGYVNSGAKQLMAVCVALLGLGFGLCAPFAGGLFTSWMAQQLSLLAHSTHASGTPAESMTLVWSLLCVFPLPDVYYRTNGATAFLVSAVPQSRKKSQAFTVDAIQSLATHGPSSMTFTAGLEAPAELLATGPTDPRRLP